MIPPPAPPRLRRGRMHERQTNNLRITRTAAFVTAAARSHPISRRVAQGVG